MDHKADLFDPEWWPYIAALLLEKHGNVEMRNDPAGFISFSVCDEK